MFKISRLGLGDEVLPGLTHLAQTGLLELADDGLKVVATRHEGGLKLLYNDGAAIVRYGRLVEFFRGVSYLIQGVGEVDETPVFTDNGYMLDCSRNAVASIPAVKKLVRHMALMGLSTLQLYTEDTFEIPEWRYFGYQRGRYTGDELRELDTYAGQFGVELIPCVQTLAHLNAALRWPEFHDIVDCNDILLAGDDKTYRLIDDMVRQLSSCFTTRRIHIGMDEAHMVGLGAYLDRHGYQDRNEIMCRHLDRVVEICRGYGFKPMMWSDMFFRLAYGGEYYDLDDKPFPPEVHERLRPDVGLVYWDYYHTGKDDYSSMIKRHKCFPNEIIFAGGAWKWGGLLPELRYSEAITRPALSACVDAGITEVFATGWGDDGAECSAFTVLPILQLFAETGYRNAAVSSGAGRGNEGNSETCNGGAHGCGINNDALASRFKACTGGVWDDFFLLDNPNDTTETRSDTVNTTKPLLYQDVMLGLLDRHVDPAVFPAHFRRCADELAAAAGRNGDWGYIFEHAATICRLLERKCTVGLEITEAYLGGDRDGLRHIADVVLPGLQKLTDDVIYSFERQWNTENKPHGLEVIHIRLGAIRVRLEAAARRIKAYLSGEVQRLEELESERLGFNGPLGDGEDINTHCNLWQNIVTASRLSW